MNHRPFCSILQCLEEVSPDSSSIGALDFGTACWACGRPWARSRRHFLHGPVDSLYHLSNLIRVSLNPWFKQVDCVGLILLFGPELNKERHEQLFSNLRMPKNHNLFWRSGRLDHPQWAIWIPKVAGSSFLSTEENTFPSWPRSIPNSTIFLWNLSSCEWVKHVDCVEFIDSSFAGLELIKQRRRQVKQMPRCWTSRLRFWKEPDAQSSHDLMAWNHLSVCKYFCGHGKSKSPLATYRL